MSKIKSSKPTMQRTLLGTLNSIGYELSEEQLRFVAGGVHATYEDGGITDGCIPPFPSPKPTQSGPHW